MYRFGKQLRIFGHEITSIFICQSSQLSNKVLYGQLPACNWSTLECVSSCNQHLPTADQVFLTCIMIVCVCTRVIHRVCMLLCIHWVPAFILLVHAAKVEQVKFDTTQLHARPELAAEQRMVDDASGDVEVRELLWLTEDATINVFPNFSSFSYAAAVWAVPTYPPQRSMAVARAICLQTPTKQLLPLGHFSSSPCPPEQSSHQVEPSPAMCTGHEAESGSSLLTLSLSSVRITCVSAEQRPLSFSFPWKTELVERWDMGLRSCSSTSLRATDCSAMAHILWQSLGRCDFASERFNQAGEKQAGIQEREEGLSFQMKTWTSVVFWQRGCSLFTLTTLLLTNIFLTQGVENWRPTNAASESQDIWAVLRRRLLPGPVHLPQIRQASLCPLHVAGRSNWNRRDCAVSARSLKLKERVAHKNPKQNIQKNSRVLCSSIVHLETSQALLCRLHGHWAQASIRLRASNVI